MNVNVTVVTRPGRVSGSITRHSVAIRLQPSSWAASSISRGIEEKKPCRIQIANARLNAVFVRISDR